MKTQANMIVLQFGRAKYEKMHIKKERKQIWIN